MYIVITQNPTIINLARENGDQVIKLNSENEKELISSQTNIERIVDEFLITMGVPANIQGFYYLKFIFEKLLSEPDFRLKRITKEIYPYIAKEFDSTSSRVERCIRHAIEIAFSRGSQKFQEKVFGFSTKVDTCIPTNSGFIFGSFNYLIKLIK